MSNEMTNNTICKVFAGEIFLGRLLEWDNVRGCRFFHESDYHHPMATDFTDRERFEEWLRLAGVSKFHYRDRVPSKQGA